MLLDLLECEHRVRDVSLLRALSSRRAQIKNAVASRCEVSTTSRPLHSVPLPCYRLRPENMTSFAVAPAFAALYASVVAIGCAARPCAEYSPQLEATRNAAIARTEVLPCAQGGYFSPQALADLEKMERDPRELTMELQKLGEPSLCAESPFDAVRAIAWPSFGDGALVRVTRGEHAYQIVFVTFCRQELRIRERRVTTISKAQWDELVRLTLAATVGETAAPRELAKDGALFSVEARLGSLQRVEEQSGGTAPLMQAHRYAFALAGMKVRHYAVVPLDAPDAVP